MTTYFMPKTYSSVEEAAKDAHFCATSDSMTEDGKDIFGFLPDGTEILCEYHDEEDSDEFWAVPVLGVKDE